MTISKNTLKELKGLSDLEIAARLSTELRREVNPSEVFRARRQHGYLTREEEEQIRQGRRNLVKGVAGTGVTLAVGGAAWALYKHFSMSTSQHSSTYLRRNSGFDISKLSTIQLELLDMPPPTLTTEEEKVILEQMTSKYSGGVNNYRRVGLTETLLVKLEPDEEFASKLVAEATKSTDHMFKFLGSEYVHRPNFSFETPKSQYDINLKPGTKTIYLVSDLDTLKVAAYKLRVGNNEIADFFGVMHKEQGKLIRRVDTFQGDATTILKSPIGPIFYNTSNNLELLIEAPPIELLHAALWPYTLRNLDADIKRKKAVGNAVAQLINDHVHREEVLVHALSILWLNQYRRERSFLFTQQELDQRVAYYGNQPYYRGTVELSRRLAEIGPRKAIELYVKNPDALFQGIPK